jgi:hypothetical protein
MTTVRYFAPGTGVERHALEGLGGLLARDDGFVWVDLSADDEGAAHEVGWW